MFVVSQKTQNLLIRGAKPSGFIPVGQPAEAAIHAKSFRVAIPRGSDVTLRVLEQVTKIRSGSLPLFPSGATNPKAKKLEATYPTELVHVSSPKIFRQVEYVDVRINPVHLNVRDHRLTPLEHVRFERNRAPACLQGMLPLQTSIRRQRHSYPQFFWNRILSSRRFTRYLIRISSHGSWLTGRVNVEFEWDTCRNADFKRTFVFTVTAATASGCVGNQGYMLNMTPVCLFCDDFEDAILSAQWTYQNGTWSEAAGALTGNHNKKANAIASPVFSGCALCSVATTVSTTGGTGSKVYMLGWYVDKKNAVELIMNEERDKWILKQRVGGSVVAKTKVMQTIDPNVSYDVQVVFDGTQFQLFLSGNLIFTMPKAAGTNPAGTVGFRIKRTTADFERIFVQ